jgi:hypothetical protein
MPKLAPLLASESTAAALLDLKPCEFRDLVTAGHLPAGREVAPGLRRWPVEELKRVGSGEAARPIQEFDL